GQKQEQTTKANASKQRQEGESVKHQTTQTRSKAGNLLLARQGIQANKFQQAMAQQGQQNLQHTKAETTQRNSENQEIRDFNTAQEQVREKKEMDKQERVQALDRDDGESGGHAGGGDMGGGASHDGDGAQHQLSGVGAIGEASAATATAEAQGAGAAARIPPEIIQKIVRQVLVGVNKKGLSEVHIDFKGSELEGTSMVITADGNKIYARVFTDNKNFGRMFKASHTELARTLKSAANLSLESLEVTGAV
ncbi:MAG: hypothetical protein AAFY60_14865, partial [Myxococcota bacterium]